VRAGRSGESEGTRSGWDFSAALYMYHVVSILLDVGDGAWREWGDEAPFVGFADLLLGGFGGDFEDGIWKIC
jgi:hypothetical protein